MQKVEFICPIKAGKIPPHISQGVRDIFSRMEGKTAKITIQERKKQRSLNQNSFYYGVVIPVVQNMFFDAGQSVSSDTVHEYLKRHVGNLTMTLQTPDGKIETVTRSSTELNTMDWEIFIEQVRAWAAQWGIEVPFPSERLTTGDANAETI